MKPKLAPKLDALLEKRPMARAARVTLFEREVRERLSLAAVELMFDGARILSEGARSDAPTAGNAYFGSTMLTVDVAALGPLVREHCDARTAERVAGMIASDGRVLGRVQKIAAREAARLAGGAIAVRAGEVRVRFTGTSIYLDVDVEE